MSHPSSSARNEDKSDELSRGGPVPPFEGGEGLPYAPEDWPNPGDIWAWKVGRRFNSSGYYTDRFLYLPKSLYKPDTPRQFASRLAVERYIASEFPHADVDAFFSSFNWKVPSTLWNSAEGKDASPPEKVKEDREGSKKENPLGTKMKRKHTAATSLAERRTRQSLRQSVRVSSKGSGLPPPNSAHSVIGLSSLNEALSDGPSKDLNSTKDIEDDQHDNGSFAGSDSPSEHMTEDFNSFLDTLVDNLAQPLPKDSMACPQTTNSLAQEDELFESQSRDNMGKVSSLREEYNKVMDEVTELETQINANLLAVQEIDNQIAQLQSRREELTRTIKSKRNLKARLTIDQQKMANAIQRITHEGEVHQSNSKKPV